jgi:DNA-binding NarL/FixJ family response regulator
VSGHSKLRSAHLALTFPSVNSPFPNTFSDNAKRLRALTKRRRQVASLVLGGLSNREIAEKLGLTVGTVKTHLHSIYEKLDIHSRTELTTALTHYRKGRHS